MNELEKLREQLASVISEMGEIHNTAEKADRDLTEEEQKNYDKLKAKAAGLEKRIERAEEVADLNANLDAPRAGAARNASINRPQGPEAKKEFESLGEFLCAVRFNPKDSRLDFVEKDASNMQASEQRMDTGSAGGFAVPTQFRDTLMEVTPQEAVFRPRANVIPAGTPPDTAISMPALDQTNGATAAKMYGGVEVQWSEEAGEVDETEFKLREITLRPREMTGSIPITDKLLRNWGSASTFLERQLRRAVVQAEDFAFLSGNGIGKPRGILNSGAAYVVHRTGASDIIYADIEAMFARAKMGGPLVWVASQSILPKLTAMKDGAWGSPDSGARVWQPNAREGEPQTLMGYPIIWNERSPVLGVKGDLALVDPSYYLIKDGSGPLVSASEHVYFKTNKTLVKIVWNVDGESWLTEPITQEGGYQVSPFVVLDVPA